MPIRAEERDRYPADWPAIAKAVKDAADWTCVGSPAFPDCRAKHGEPHPVTGSKVIITVAHLDHTPENVDPSNLRAWCQKCHNTFDAPNRAKGVKARRTDHCGNRAAGPCRPKRRCVMGRKKNKRKIVQAAKLKAAEEFAEKQQREWSTTRRQDGGVDLPIRKL